MECSTLESIVNGLKVYKPKRKFKTLDEAIKQAKYVNGNPNQIHKVVSYKCTICFNYHVGRNGKQINKRYF